MRFLAGLAALLLAFGASAEQIDFDVRLAGVKAGELSISAETSGGQYAVRGRLQSTGFVGALRKIRYDAASRGRVNGSRFVPSSYSENTDTGSRRNSAVMEFRGGVPQVKTYDPPRKPRKYDIDPASQGGALDPLTALYASLRAVTKAEACRVNLRTFDGRRAAKVEMAKSAESASEIVCRGAYTRVAGYSQKDLNERRTFPFTLAMEPASGGLWRVARMELETLYGKAELVRR